MHARSAYLLTVIGLLSACAGGQGGSTVDADSLDADSLRRELARYTPRTHRDSGFALAALDSATVVVVTGLVDVSRGWRLMWSGQEFQEIGDSLRASIERTLAAAAVRVVPGAPDTLRLTIQNGTVSLAAQPTVSVWSMQLSLRRPMVLVASPGMVTTQSVWYMNHVDVGVGPSFQSPPTARRAAGRMLDAWMQQFDADVRAVRPDSSGGPAPER